MSAVPLNPGGHALDMTGWTQTHLARVEQALSQWVGHGAPAGLGDAMRYAVLDGGKRLRPALGKTGHGKHRQHPAQRHDDDGAATQHLREGLGFTHAG